MLHVADQAAGTEMIDTKGADNFIVVVVNTEQEGQSRRPGLCIGTAEEVATCKTTLVPPDAGLPDAGAPDGGTSTPPPDNDPATGCACALPGHPQSTSPIGLAGVPTVLYALVRRRRRRRAA